MNINGKNGLACLTSMDEMPSRSPFVRCLGCRSSAT
jgi:succinate dehydrogenase/fumarate reductase-like Fe-S protein